MHKRLNFPEAGSAGRNQFEESDDPSYCHGYIPESNAQWWHGGLTGLQERRIQHLGHLEQFEIEAEAANPKRKADQPRALANVNMIFILPAEYACEEGEWVGEEVATRLVLHSQPAVSEKPKKEKHRHLKPLYLKSFINSKPMTKMLVGCHQIHVVHHMLKALEDSWIYLTKTNMMLKIFGGNPSQGWVIMNMKLTIGRRDWIHINSWIPYMMY